MITSPTYESLIENFYTKYGFVAVEEEEDNETIVYTKAMNNLYDDTYLLLMEEYYLND